MPRIELRNFPFIKTDLYFCPDEQNNNLTCNQIFIYSNGVETPGLITHINNRINMYAI